MTIPVSNSGRLAQVRRMASEGNENMSTENITEKRNLPGSNRLLVVFETRDGQEHKYSYGPVAAKKILAGRDPSEFKAHKEK
jgi:hypothetical protein